MSGLTPIGGGGGLAPIGGGSPQPAAAPPQQQTQTIYSGPAPAAPGAASPHPSPPGRPVSAAAAYDEPAGPGKAILGGVLGAVVLGLALLAFFLLRPPAPVPAPAGFTEWVAADRSVACDTPDGWQVVARGRASATPEHVSQDGVRISHGAARIDVTLSTLKGLMTQQLFLGDGPVPEMASGAGAAIGIHTPSKKSVKGRFQGYKEEKVEAPAFTSQMGGVIVKEGARSMEEAFAPDYQVSEFTADGNRFGLGGKVRGYRATLAGTEFIAAVVCECPERDWEKLKPAFHRVLGSLREAGGTRDPKDEDDEDLSVPGAGVSVPGSLPGVGGRR